VSLFRAEARRLVKRRFTRYFVIGAVVVLVAVAVGMFFTNKKVGPATVAAAKAQAEQEYQRQLGYAEQEKKRCAAAPGQDCAQLFTPTRENFEAKWYLPPTFDFREKFGDMVITMAALLALAAFVVGASYVGAEWSSGGMMNLLLWRPRRLKVLGVKLAALLVALTALTVVVAAAWTGVFALIANLRGSLATMTSGAWQSFGLMELRGLALVLVAGAVGFGLASLGRHTAMALGAAVGVIVVFQVGLGTALEMANVKFVEAYLVPVWGLAWMRKSVVLQNLESCNFSATQGCQPDTLTITWPMAGGVLAAVLVLVVVASMWTMRSRDIT
jgi:hypothetical protein